MKAYLAKLAVDQEKALSFLASDAGERGLKKITGSLRPGAKCAWCYKDDDKFWKKEHRKHGDFPYPLPKDWPYLGFIVPFPNTNGRCEMEAENVCVVVVDYPIEKENPETDWCVLACLLESEDLHRFYVFGEMTV